MERKEGGRLLTGKIKVPALVAPLAGVSCLQLREGCEGKVMFLCHVVLPITAPRGLSMSKNITLASWMSECWRWMGVYCK